MSTSDPTGRGSVAPGPNDPRPSSPGQAAVPRSNEELERIIRERTETAVHDAMRRRSAWSVARIIGVAVSVTVALVAVAGLAILIGTATHQTAPGASGPTIATAPATITQPTDTAPLEPNGPAQVGAFLKLPIAQNSQLPTISSSNSGVLKWINQGILGACQHFAGTADYGTAVGGYALEYGILYNDAMARKSCEQLQPFIFDPDDSGAGQSVRQMQVEYAFRDNRPATITVEFVTDPVTNLSLPLVTSMTL
jgi:hypothetical protein